jgi:hypothetical protein
MRDELGVHGPGEAFEERPVHRVAQQDVPRETLAERAQRPRDRIGLEVHEYALDDDDDTPIRGHRAQPFAERAAREVERQARERVRALGDGEALVLVTDDLRLVDLVPLAAAQAIRTGVEARPNGDDARARGCASSSRCTHSSMMRQRTMLLMLGSVSPRNGSKMRSPLLIHEAPGIAVVADRGRALGVLHAHAAAVVRGVGDRVHARCLPAEHVVTCVRRSA